MRDAEREVGGRGRREKESEARGCWKQKGDRYRMEE